MPSSVMVGCIRSHIAPQKLHSNMFGSALISSSGSSHSGQVLVGPRTTFLKSDVFSVGIVRGGEGPTMSVDWKRGINLLRKAFRKLGLPDYWHKHSPKTYMVWQHGVMLVFYRQYCRSYTDFVEWLPNTKLPEYMQLNAIPDEGTLCKEEKRLKNYLEAAATLIVLPVLPKRFVASADMTGLQTRRASPYYVRRVMGSFSRRGFARLELLVHKKFILGFELRLLRKDELKMLKSLRIKVKKKPTTLLYDKKGDCEAFHEWLEEQGIRSIAPVRKGGKRGRIRRRLMKHFPQKIYNRRNYSETVNYVFKNRYGDSLKAVTLKGRRAEVATKILAHNLWTRLKVILHELFNEAITS